MKSRNMNKEDLQRTLNRLYECRNLEISNLWQRSVFLSVFLILCFTAYGYLALELKTTYDENTQDQQLLLTSTICLFVCFVGTAFSVVWILMSKGSKGWYEVYERAIYKFEQKHYLALDLPKKNRMGNMKLKYKNDSILSTAAGSYSPSRINVAIGQISLVVWISLTISHAIFNFTISAKVNSITFNGITLSILLVGTGLILYLIKSRYLKSGFL